MNRVGERYLQGKDGCYGWAECILYRNAHDIDVKFDNTGCIRRHVSAAAFRRGCLKDVFAPVLYGVGYFGDTTFKSRIDGHYTLEYMLWNSLLNRVYSGHYTYCNASCCEEFHCFALFCDWLTGLSNYEDIVSMWSEGHKVVIDKDILVKGNTVYAPEYCSLVPAYVNVAIERYDNNCKGYPIGVSCISPYGVQCKLSRYGESYVKYFGFRSCNESQFAEEWRNIAKEYYSYHGEPYDDYKLAAIGAAFEKYRELKLEHIQDMANNYYNVWDDVEKRYWSFIEKRTYDALMNWEIKITD